MYGIFVGSFNPPTKAHLEICLELQNRFKKIIFIPVNTKAKHLVSLYNRIAMLRFYTKKYSFLEIDDIMKDYSYFDYRIVDLLKNKYHNIEIILGSDILENIDQFDHYLYLLKTYRFTIVTRNSTDVYDIIQRKYSKYQDNFTVLSLQIDISSSIVRELIQKKKSTKDFLDQEIDDYIKNNHLYV